MNYFIPLEAEGVYHIFNHANGWDDFYCDANNCAYFLKKLRFHLWPVIDIYAYNLLPNHFHLIVRVKSETEIIVGSRQWCRFLRIPFKKLSPNQQFSNFFNGYTKAMNKVYRRQGSLFKKNYKRVLIEDDDHLRHAIAYVHTNAEKHNLIQDFRNWEFSSYPKIICDKPTYLLRGEVISLYGGFNNFKIYHKNFLYNRNVATFKYDNFTGW